MTVGELIKALQAFDSEATVWMPDWNEEYRPPTAVCGVDQAVPSDWDTTDPDEDPKPDTFDGGVILRP